MPLPNLDILQDPEEIKEKEVEEEQMTEEEEEETLFKKTMMIRMEMTDKPEAFERYYQMSKKVDPFDFTKAMDDFFPKRVSKKPSEEELNKMKKIRNNRRKRQLEEYGHLIDKKKNKG